MRTKKYWENRYDDFCNEVLGDRIRICKLNLYDIKEEIIRMERFYKEETENNESSPEEIILYCYINHELNLLDPIGCCYPSISNEYSSYAWKLVDALLDDKDRIQFQSKVKEQIEYLVFSLGNQDDKTVKTTCHKISKIINKIYDSLDFLKNLHKEQFSESVFWKKQLKTFQYKVLGENIKWYASALTFLIEERDHLIAHKDENMKENYRDFIHFLYINHYLNLIDPTMMYYPQFHYQYEKYAWEILNVYKNSSAKEFPIEAIKIIVDMYEQEGIPWKRNQSDISYAIGKIKAKLDKINK